MKQRSETITNRLGLHARAAARLVKLAQGYRCEILLARSDAVHRTVDAKSIFGILMLAATQGTQIEVMTEGEDESDAIDAICRLIEGKFGEE